ncbi:MAG: hypothetical protein WCK64_01905 [Synechococcaceae cyanobacterium ELA445]|jgi:hypothetical protein
MARPSIALFLASAGLLMGAAGCGKAPEPTEQKSPAAHQATPGSSNPGQEVPKKHDAGEGGEGGEG